MLLLHIVASLLLHNRGRRHVTSIANIIVIIINKVK